MDQTAGTVVVEQEQRLQVVVVVAAVVVAVAATVVGIAAAAGTGFDAAAVYDRTSQCAMGETWWAATTATTSKVKNLCRVAVHVDVGGRVAKKSNHLDLYIPH